MRDPVIWKAVFGNMTPKEARQAQAKADKVRYARLQATGALPVASNSAKGMLAVNVMRHLDMASER